ncbi:helix-turn-helix domain-containing protein [Candidatus Sororendozoicomonas aggregata]|uniref:helix-turn-helix domain-containing protein n=1 Tax=Candidatus Sororendozoicomonas aggregata TaxID=3073239 RepID=UPI002ECFEF2A
MTGAEYKAFRKALGLSQEQLAETLGVGKKTIVNQEKTVEVPPVYVLSLKYIALQKKREIIKDAFSFVLKEI